MLGDILLIQEKHKKAGEAIIQKILENKKDKYIVAISGESGSGKSELTHVIAKGLRKHGIFAKPLHVDNFYNTLPLKRRQWRLEEGIENVVGYNEYLWDDINRVIRDFKNSRKSEMPCVDLVTEQVDKLTTDFSEVDMLIVDGLYAIKTEGVDLRIFIDLTYLETKEKHTKDSRGKEVMDEVRWATLAQEHKMVQALKPLADLIVSKDYKVVEAMNQ
ncbi:MAG: uridine kinase [Chlorobi bacterium]|nr:uridine kinase [Chlorobiota bacterium]